MRVRKDVAVKKICPDCGNEFEPEKDYYYVCRLCYYSRLGETLPRRCAAVKDNGEQCGAWAKHDQYFCGTHMRVGYGLFTLAVQHADRQAGG